MMIKQDRYGKFLQKLVVDAKTQSYHHCHLFVFTNIYVVFALWQTLSEMFYSDNSFNPDNYHSEVDAINFILQYEKIGTEWLSFPRLYSYYLTGRANFEPE